MGLYSNSLRFQDKPPNLDLAAVNVSCSLIHVDSDAIVGIDTAKSMAQLVRAEDIKFIGGRGLTHTNAPTSQNARCYMLDDVMGKFNDKEAKRDDARKEYRRKAAAFAKQLPFEDGCIGMRERRFSESPQQRINHS